MRFFVKVGPDFAQLHHPGWSGSFRIQRHKLRIRRGAAKSDQLIRNFRTLFQDGPQAALGLFRRDLRLCGDVSSGVFGQTAPAQSLLIKTRPGLAKFLKRSSIVAGRLHLGASCLLD